MRHVEQTIQALESEDNVVYCETQGIDAYIAVGRKKHGPDPPGQENDAQIFRNNEAWHAMRDKLKTEEGREVYRHRKHIVEPVFDHACPGCAQRIHRSP